MLNFLGKLTLLTSSTSGAQKFSRRFSELGSTLFTLNSFTSTCTFISCFLKLSTKDGSRLLTPWRQAISEYLKSLEFICLVLRCFYQVVGHWFSIAVVTLERLLRSVFDADRLRLLVGLIWPTLINLFGLLLIILDELLSRSALHLAPWTLL